MKIKKIFRIKRTDSSEGDILAAEWEKSTKKEKIFKKIEKKYEFLSEGRNPFTGEWEKGFMSKKYFYVVIYDDIEEE